jgi:hypothetical protein
MRSRAVIAATTGAAILVATAAAFAGSGSAQAPTGRTLTFTEGQRGSTFKLVDNPPRSPGRTERTFRLSVGDFFVFTNPMLDAAGQRAGTLRGTCDVTRGGRFERAFFLCHAVAKLRNGDIAIEAATPLGDVTRAPITGGTGLYNGARGTFSSREQGRRTIDTFELLP